MSFPISSELITPTNSPKSKYFHIDTLISTQGKFRKLIKNISLVECYSNVKFKYILIFYIFLEKLGEIEKTDNSSENVSNENIEEDHNEMDWLNFDDTGSK